MNDQEQEDIFENFSEEDLNQLSFYSRFRGARQTLLPYHIRKK